MGEHDEYQRTIDGRTLRPESLMMSYGYRPEWSEGALKSPIFQTSTFAFETAEEGKAFFEVALGLREQGQEERLGLIYSRLNNPDLEILEHRLTLWDGAEAAAVFASGMAAISTTILELVQPGQLILHSEPLYGGTAYLFQRVLSRYGIRTLGFMPDSKPEEIEALVEESGQRDRLAMIYVETPANPTNDLIDIEMCSGLARRLSTLEHRIVLAVDNTFLGPLWQHPLKLGADLVLYSATKYLGGHSDVIAGVCLGSKELMRRIHTMRTFLGSMASPWTGWLLLRSLETLKLRMTCQMKNARAVADFLNDHHLIERVYYPGLLDEEHPKFRLYKKQCSAPGAMISFDIAGGEPEAFRFLNALKLIKLAVSLGGTESLAEHPSTMTHSELTPEMKARAGITDKMVRLSIGVENPEDLIADLGQALGKV